MASTASDLLKFEKQATGENASTWGTKANTAMSRIEEGIAGFTNISLASLGGANYTLDDTQYTEHVDGSNTSESHCAMVKATGTLDAAEQIIVPLRTKEYLIWNATGGSFAVTVGGATGGTITVPQGYLQQVFCDGTNVEAAGAPVSVDGDINMNGRGIYDTNGNQLILFTETASAVNEITVGNAATGNDPTITASGETNVGLNLVPKGTGTVKIEGADANFAGGQTIWVPVAAMQPTTSNGCAALVNVETTAGRPDMTVLDFDATADEHAQFQVMFPKSWNLGTITAQFGWTSTATDTDGVTWGIQGVACGDSDTIDVAYGTAVVVDDANISAAEDFYLTAATAAVTIAGTPADDQICFFRVFRDVSDSNDTATEDARLIGVKIIFTTDLGNDS
jgi:hypothetical protein